MKKKTAAMVLAALMAFSMTACGNGSTQKEDDSTAADQETTETTETDVLQNGNSNERGSMVLPVRHHLWDVQPLLFLFPLVENGDRGHHL